VLRVFRHLQRSPIVSIPVTAQNVGLSAPTVAKALRRMIQLKIIRK